MNISTALLHRKFHCLLFFLLCTPTLLFSQVQWQQTNGPHGGRLNAMAAVGEGVWASIGVEGVFHFQDGVWAKVSDALFYELVSVGDMLIGIRREAGFPYRYYRSVDGGATWELLSFSGRSGVAISVIGEQVWAVSGDSLFVSDDGLLTRELVAIVPEAMRPPMGRTDMLLASAGFFGERLYRSVDQGKTWEQLTPDLPVAGSGGTRFEGGEQRFYANVATQGLFTSTDGEHWGDISPDLIGNEQLYVYEGNDDQLVGYTERSNVYQYDGSDWVRVAMPATILSMTLGGGQSFFSTISGLYALDNNGDLALLNGGLRHVHVLGLGKVGDALFAAGGGAIYRSLNGGDDWEQRAPLPASWFVTHGQTIFAVGYRAIWRSTDFGETWVSMQTQFDAIKLARWGTTDPDLPFSDVAVADDGTVYAAVSHTFSEHGGNRVWKDGGVFRSDDNGETWQEISGNLPFDGITVVPVYDLHMLDGGGLLISTLEGVFYSESGGSSWVNVDGNLLLDENARSAGTFFELNGIVYLQAPRVGIFRMDMDMNGWREVASFPGAQPADQLRSTDVNVVDGRFYMLNAGRDGNLPVYEVFAFDGDEWTDITDQMPAGVGFFTFLQDGEDVYAGSVSHSVWKLNAASSVDAEAGRLAAELRVTPNPFAGEFNVTLRTGQAIKFCRVALVDASGEILLNIYEGPIASGEVLFPVNVQAVPTGACFLQVTGDGKTIVQSLVRT